MRRGSSFRCRTRGAVVVALAGLFVFTLVADDRAAWFSSKLEDLEVEARLIRDLAEIEALLGSDLDGEYILVHVKLRPLYNANVTLTRHDFLLRSYQDNERSTAQSPERIAGSAVLVMGKGRVRQGANVFNESREPVVIGGAPGTGTRPRRIGNPSNSGLGTGTTSSETVEVKQSDRPPSTLVERLAQYELPMGETRSPVEGYLYFQLSPKYKPKKLGLSYDGTAGECKIRFK